MGSAPLTKAWWSFRDLWCRPFGHVLYVPRGWKFWAVPWECACAVIQIGTFGYSPWSAFLTYWPRMRTRRG